MILQGTVLTSPKAGRNQTLWRGFFSSFCFLLRHDNLIKWWSPLLDVKWAISPFGVEPEVMAREEEFSFILQMFGRNWKSSQAWMVGTMGRTGVPPHTFHTILGLGDIDVCFLIKDLHIIILGIKISDQRKSEFIRINVNNGYLRMG